MTKLNFNTIDFLISQLPIFNENDVGGKRYFAPCDAQISPHFVDTENKITVQTQCRPLRPAYAVSQKCAKKQLPEEEMDSKKGYLRPSVLNECKAKPPHEFSTATVATKRERSRLGIHFLFWERPF